MDIIVNDKLVLEVVGSRNVVEITESAAQIVEIQNNEQSVLEIKETPTQVLEIVQQGAQGAKGDNGGSITLTAGETISAYRCVYVGIDGDFYRLISSDTTNCFAFAGIITSSVDANDEAEIKQEGILTNTSWSFTANQPVFLGASGEVTQIVPTSGFLLRLGFATTSQSILFNVAELTILGV